ncbi:DUF5129 domain-containing protein [Brevibacterium sp. R8603A2]|uniref:DUF5129 domain-containing protein n=1 Tax=Brevibacterium sp. R8603A2 TaxID=2929779 RepID=UPI001FF96490|nr:DUF5129 domain-containing protein [Brevibacterium sp. R8603A2]MCK1803560.1 DUF5129 domain-containing protein [Brevibacterium sp. R8603A2]
MSSPARATPSQDSHPLQRTRRRLDVLTGVACALVVLAAVAAFLLGRPDASITEVHIADDAAVLDPTLIEEQISDLAVHRPTRVVVLTLDGEVSDNINEQTLAWARLNPDLDLLSDDGEKWKDGTLLITASVEANGEDGGPGSGQVGTYFGDDLAPGSTEAEQEIQSHGYEAFQQRDWNRGVTEIAEAAAEVMGRPFFARPLVIGIAAAVLLGLLLVNRWIVAHAVTGYSRNRRRLTDSAAEVDGLVGQTELIPDLGFGTRVKESARTTLHTYTDLLEKRDSIDATSLPSLHGLNLPLFTRMSRFDEGLDGLEADGAMLRTANVLYAREPGWESVWRSEVDDLRQDIRDAQVSKDIRERADDPELLRELEAFCSRTLDRLDAIEAAGIGGGDEELDSGLTALTDLRGEFAGYMDRVRDSAFVGMDDDKESYISGAIEEQSVSRRRAGSLTGYYDSPGYLRPMAFGIGYATGLRNHRQAQEAAKNSSSSSSTAGYGSTGGGFSGAGSSSRF